MRLIDGDALKETIKQQLCVCDDPSRMDCIICSVGDCLMFIDEAPTIETEPVKHGTWERIDGKIHGYVCNICEYGICTGKMPYCPQCGARMDGEAE